MFNVTADNGVTAVTIDGKHIDVGMSGSIAGIEFSATEMRMFDGNREGRAANAVVMLDCTPHTLLMMAMAILDKLDLPAFNDREWRIIASALQQTADGADSERLDMADTILASADKINKLT